MSSQTVKKLLCSINCTQAQVVELSSFKGKLDEMCDSTAGDLHKVSKIAPYSFSL